MASLCNEISLCLNQVSIAVIKHNEQRQLQQERDGSYISRLQFILERSQGRNKSRGHGGRLLTGLLLHGQLSLHSSVPQDHHLYRGGTTQLAGSSHVSHYENALQTCLQANLMGKHSLLKVPFPKQFLTCVRLIISEPGQYVYSQYFIAGVLSSSVLDLIGLSSQFPAVLHCMYGL